jgi:Uri superfamily endonuclease
VVVPVSDDQEAVGGTYTLLVGLRSDVEVDIGALGEHRIPAGWYGYTGSALGRGGFARVERHRELAVGERDTRHWHIDYLLGHPGATLWEVVRSPGADIECAVAERLPEGPVAGFGASDCDCRSHLTRAADGPAAMAMVQRAHRESG